MQSKSIPVRRLLAFAVLGTMLVSFAVSAASGQAAGKKHLRIAYLAAAKTNAYVAAALTAISADAKKHGVSLVVYDAEFNPQTQLAQCEDAVTKKVNAIVSLAAAGVPLIPCVKEAKKAHIPFVATNQPIGTSITTGNPTTPGVTSQVLTPLATIANGDAAEVAAACKSFNPCNVVDLDASQEIPVQFSAYEAAFKKIEAANPDIKVTDVNAGADLQGGLTAMQNQLQTGTKPNVIVSPNSQPTEGAVQALEAAGLTPGKQVKVVSNGATSYQFADVKSGKYFSTYTQLPRTEADLALTYAIAAAKGKKVPKWTDPHAPHKIPYEITKANLNKLNGFTPQW